MSLGEGLRRAASRIPIIFYWMVAHFLFAFTVPERFKPWLCGLRWRQACLLIPPLLINEPMGFVPTLQRSSQLMRTFAGKHPQSNFTYTWFSLLLRLLSMIPVSLGFKINTFSAIITGAAITFVLLLIVSIIFKAAIMVILQALYDWIAKGKVFRGFNAEDISIAISPTTFKN